MIRGSGFTPNGLVLRFQPELVIHIDYEIQTVTSTELVLRLHPGHLWVSRSLYTNMMNPVVDLVLKSIDVQGSRPYTGPMNSGKGTVVAQIYRIPEIIVPSHVVDFNCKTDRQLVLSVNGFHPTSSMLLFSPTLQPNVDYVLTVRGYSVALKGKLFFKFIGNLPNERRIEIQ